MFLGLKILPKTAVSRRGAEGRIVNEKYIERYNEFFIEYFKRIQLNKSLIETDEMNIAEMNNKIFETILYAFN